MDRGGVEREMVVLAGLLRGFNNGGLFCAIADTAPRRSAGSVPGCSTPRGGVPNEPIPTRQRDGEYQQPMKYRLRLKANIGPLSASYRRVA